MACIRQRGEEDEEEEEEEDTPGLGHEGTRTSSPSERKAKAGHAEIRVYTGFFPSRSPLAHPCTQTQQEHGNRVVFLTDGTESDDGSRERIETLTLEEGGGAYRDAYTAPESYQSTHLKYFCIFLSDDS
ncbi:uncharacterized [Tachysurus ichikawai]